MSIYATLWEIQVLAEEPKVICFGTDGTATALYGDGSRRPYAEKWVRVVGQGVPPHIGHSVRPFPEQPRRVCLPASAWVISCPAPPAPVSRGNTHACRKPTPPPFSNTWPVCWPNGGAER